MVLVNGTKINNDATSTEQTKKPSLNEILDKMQVNYNNINYSNNQQNVDVFSSSEEKQQTATSSNNLSYNSLLASLLPMILSNKSGGAEILKNEQNELLHTLIKNLNNPLLEKLFELLPKLSNKNSAKKVETETKQKNEPKIDSFIKTSDFDRNN